MQGLLTCFVCDPGRRDWLATGSAQGSVAVWDLRFQVCPPPPPPLPWSALLPPPPSTLRPLPHSPCSSCTHLMFLPRLASALCV